MFDKTIKTYKEKKLNIQQFINSLIILLDSSQEDINDITKLSGIIDELQTSSEKDYSKYKNILIVNFDIYKMSIRKDNIKLKKQLKILLGRGEGVIFDNDPMTIDPFPMSNWPCMYYNKSSCPQPRCKVEEDEQNPDNDNKPYTNVVCIPNENIEVEQCTGYYGEKNCRKHYISMEDEVEGGTQQIECDPKVGGVKCHGKIPPNYECEDPDHLLNIYGSGVLHDTVIATKCMTEEELNTLPPKYINKKSLNGNTDLERLCKSKPNGKWNDDLEQCYDTSDCYSRNSDTCEIDTDKCLWKNLFSATSSEDGKYVPQGFCLSK